MRHHHPRPARPAWHRLRPAALSWYGALLLGSLGHFGTAWVAVARAEPATAAASTPAIPQGTADRTALPPALMLANIYRGHADVREYWISEKYDGVRAYWDGRRLVTRQGVVIAAPAWFTAGWPTRPLDGELWAGRGRFDIASAAARRLAPDEQTWRGLRFMVFDLPAHGGSFDARLRALRAMPLPAGGHIEIVPQRKVRDARALRRLMREVVAGGGEGLMLHRGSSSYQARRSDDLLKFKPYEDAEAIVIGHLPGRGKYAGQLGALRVRSADGREFSIGSGLSDALRRQPPPIGAVVTYRHRGLHASGLPRFATYLRLRGDLALDPASGLSAGPPALAPRRAGAGATP